MSSAPVSPVATPKPTTPAPQPTTSVIAKDWSWLVSHLGALIIVGALIVAGVLGVEKLVQDHDVANATKYTVILQQQQQQTQVLQKQLQADEAQSAVIEAQLLAQNAQLTKEISARNIVVAAQVKTDATLSTQQAAARLAQQTNASVGEVTASDANVSIDLPITRAIVANLDELPVVQANLADTTTKLNNETTVATSAQSDLSAADKVIAAQTLAATDAAKACNAQIAVVKAKARRSKIKSFLVGLGIGLGLWAGHAL
jgi:hypothetical protein